MCKRFFIPFILNQNYQMKFSGLSNQTISKEGDWDSNTFSKHICDHALPCKLCITLLLNTPLNFYLISNKYILHLAVIIARLFRVFILQRGKRKKKKICKRIWVYVVYLGCVILESNLSQTLDY